MTAMRDRDDPRVSWGPGEWFEETQRLEAEIGRLRAETEEFLRFAWDAYTRDVGHPPGWDWRERIEAIRVNADRRAVPQ